MENNGTAVVEQSAPAINVQVPAPAQADAPVVEQDILTKVNQFKQKNQAQNPASSNNDIGFDYKEIDNIKDPIAKEFAIKAYKSMESGVQKKFQDLAAQRKQLEAKMQEMNAWTPERIQQLLADPAFVQAAQSVVQTQNPPNSGLTDEQFSALTDSERQKFVALEKQVNTLQQVNLQNLINQTDEQLKMKYAGYNPDVVNNGLRELSSMQPHQIREYVYRAKNYESDVKAAYEFGRQESGQLNQQKINSMSVTGNQIANNDGMPTRQANQSDISWFQTLANFRLSQANKK